MGNRGDLTNEQWEQIKTLLPQPRSKRGRPAQEHRQLLNGILWQGSQVRRLNSYYVELNTPLQPNRAPLYWGHEPEEETQ